MLRGCRPVDADSWPERSPSSTKYSGFRYFEIVTCSASSTERRTPTVPEAADHVLIGQEDETYAGGSYVIVQKYLHQIADWNGLTTEDQERVIGRSKLANVEMPYYLKPADSHVALTVIEDPDGTEHKILRDNMPFGLIATGDRGTYFIGYARTPLVIEQMLTNMFIGNPPGTTDRILDFSTAVTGALFFVPTTDFLDDPPEGPGTAFGPSTVTEKRIGPRRRPTLPLSVIRCRTRDLTTAACVSEV